jgi:hypothetical protein
MLNITYPFRSYFLNTGNASRGSPSCGGKQKSSSDRWVGLGLLPGLLQGSTSGCKFGPRRSSYGASICLSSELTRRRETLVMVPKTVKFRVRADWYVSLIAAHNTVNPKKRR